MLALAFALVAGAVGGCGSTNTSDQIHAKVQQFAQAVAAGDANTLCQQVFAPVLLEHFAAAGIPCPHAMHIFLGTVHRPTLLIGRVVVNGNTAEAITLSGARHQIGALDAVQLVNTSSGWRVSGLGSPLLPKGSTKHA